MQTKKVELIADSRSRLDVFLTESLKKHLNSDSVSRNYIKQLIDSGNVTVNHLPCDKKSWRLRIGDVISIQLIAKSLKKTTVEPRPIQLNILYEDDYVIVINKQSGLIVHPAITTSETTLLHGLVSYLYGDVDGDFADFYKNDVEKTYEDNYENESEDDFENESDDERNYERFNDSHEQVHMQNETQMTFPALVHRLDKDTTGVMIVAKNLVAYRSLVSQFASKTAMRNYYVFVWGKLKKNEGTICTFMNRSLRDRQKMAVTQSGKVAITQYKLIRFFDLGSNKFCSLVECSLKTGRTHQIRVHMKHIGNPVIGDKKYFSAISKNYESYLESRNVIVSDLISRQALHSHTLIFEHPGLVDGKGLAGFANSAASTSFINVSSHSSVSKSRIKIEAPIPKDMKLLYKCFSELKMN